MPMVEFRARRVEFGLEPFVESTDPEFAPVHGREDLDVVDRVEVEVVRDPPAGEIHREFGGLDGIVTDDEVEIGVGVVAVGDGHLARVDPVGVDHDAARFGLAKDVVEPNEGHDAGGDEIAEDIAGTHRRQLVGIAHQDQSAPGRDGLEEVGGELDVEHGNFVHHDHVRFEGILAVAGEGPAARVELEEPVDGPGIAAGGLGESLGRAAGGCCQQNPLFPRVEDLGDAAHQGRLAGTGTTGDHEDPAVEGGGERLSLVLGQLDGRLAAGTRRRPGRHRWRPRRRCGRGVRGCGRQPWPRRPRAGG